MFGTIDVRVRACVYVNFYSALQQVSLAFYHKELREASTLQWEKRSVTGQVYIHLDSVYLDKGSTINLWRLACT